MSEWITWIFIFVSWLFMMVRTSKLGDHHVQLGSGQTKIYNEVKEKEEIE